MPRGSQSARGSPMQGCAVVAEALIRYQLTPEANLAPSPLACLAPESPAKV
jgi:hypothetical protein